MSKILYIDDSESNLFVVELLLQTYGGTLETAINVQQGTEKVTNTAYDLILSDILLPDGNGFDILAQCRKPASKNQFVPVLAFTADVTVGTREQIIFEGFTDYITKPFKSEDLTLRFDIYLKPSEITLDLTYYTNFVKSADDWEKIKSAIRADFVSFEKGFFHAWHQKNYQALRNHIHRIEFICSNLKIQPLMDAFQGIRDQGGFTKDVPAFIMMVKRDLLQVYRELETLF